MLDTAVDLDLVMRRLSRGLTAVPAGSRGLVSVSLPLCGAFPRGRLVEEPGAVYWARPADGLRRVGVGTAQWSGARGPQRFRRLRAAHRRLERSWLRLDPEGGGAEPLAALGFGFSPEPASDALGLGSARLWVPVVLLRQEGSRVSLICSASWQPARSRPAERRRWLAQVGPALCALLGPGEGARPRPAGRPVPRADADATGQWLARADRAVAALRRRELEKVVLTRSLEVALPAPVPPMDLLDWLGRHYPGCTQFACRGRDATLLGATPERLVGLAGDRAVADAIAGTAPCAVSEPDGHRAGEALLGDPKLQVEHAVVVRDVAAILAPWCERLNVPDGPQLLTLPRLRHLWTPVHGVVRRGVSLLDLVGALHPTPAVGGLPRQEALQWLQREGEGGRGWYTGGIGWIGPAGDGEVVVSLRCALLRGLQATLYAGAGLVADSRPEQELAETEWKLATMLAALEAA